MIGAEQHCANFGAPTLLPAHHVHSTTQDWRILCYSVVVLIYRHNSFALQRAW